MKLLIFVLSFFLVVSVKAETLYKVQLDLSLNGKPAQSSIMTVAAGDVNTLTFQQNGQKHFVDFTVKETKAKPQQVHLSFTIGQGAGQKKKILSSPQILAELGKAAEVTVGDSQNKEAVHLKVTAQKSK